MAKFLLSGFADEIDKDLKIQVNELKKLGINMMEMRGVYGKPVTDYTVSEVKEFKKYWMTMESRFPRSVPQ